jgi:hypothetical protein
MTRAGIVSRFIVSKAMKTKRSLICWSQSVTHRYCYFVIAISLDIGASQ